MYDAMVTEPRLVTGWAIDTLPDSVEQLRASLSTRYDLTFDSVHVNLYRSGADSVAWHGDTVRKVLLNPLVGIVSLGERRVLRMRPKGGGESQPFVLHAGDLFVMGGTAQADWQHAVPKVARAGARVSVQFRHST